MFNEKMFCFEISYFCLENGVCFLDIVEHNHYGVPQRSVPNLLINILNSLLHNHSGVPQGSVPNLLINILNSLFKGTLSVILGDPPCGMTMPDSQRYP